MALGFCCHHNKTPLLPFLLTFGEQSIISYLSFFFDLCAKLKKKYKPYILVTVSLQFLHVDIVILYCNSERSATPTEFAIMILMPFRIPFYVTF